MGISKENRIWPRWASTVGIMREEEITVHAFCTNWQVTLTVDLDLLCAIQGQSFTLIDRSGRCKVVGCQGRTFFLAIRERSGVPAMRLTSRSKLNYLL
ncbi:hypothetical protein [Sandarakinorhabdus sp.]|uniref:hypothetical protein n=1 Tax=Sandarakinorhabdus sp. TaxID=1916663 RepID=UPI003F730F59